MKKRATILILSVFVISFSGFGQDSDKKEIGGIRGGFHSAVMVEGGSKPDTASALSSFYIGFFKDKKIAPILFFGSGIEYFQNGLKYPSDSKRILHTLSIPLDLKVKIGPAYALGGAAANFKVKEKYEPGETTYNTLDVDKSKGFDVAAFAGAGVKIFFISIEVRYHWGLLEARPINLYNRYLQIGAAISF